MPEVPCRKKLASRIEKAKPPLPTLSASSHLGSLLVLIMLYKMVSLMFVRVVPTFEERRNIYARVVFLFRSILEKLTALIWKSWDCQASMLSIG